MSADGWVPVFRRLTRSEKLADLPDDAARVFYQLLLLAVDDHGRATARPRQLRADVWPLLERSLEDTTRALEACRAVGLVEIFASDDGLFLALPDHDEKAGSVGRASHRRASAFPDPEGLEPLGPEWIEAASVRPTPPANSRDCPASPASARDCPRPPDAARDRPSLPDADSVRPPLPASPPRAAARTRGSGSRSSSGSGSDPTRERAHARQEEATAPHAAAASQPPARDAPPDPAAPPPPVDAQATETSVHTRFIALWCQRFEDATARTYPFDGREAKRVQQIRQLANDDFALMQQQAERLFASDYWRREGFDLGTLISQWRRLLAANPDHQPAERIHAPRNAHSPAGNGKLEHLPVRI